MALAYYQLVVGVESLLVVVVLLLQGDQLEAALSLVVGLGEVPLRDSRWVQALV